MRDKAGLASGAASLLKRCSVGAKRLLSKSSRVARRPTMIVGPFSVNGGLWRKAAVQMQ
jgi:hypothetical protein